MRVSELANDLGKTSKEILEVIKRGDAKASLYAASNVSKEQEDMVRAAFASKKAASVVNAEAAKAEAPKAEATKAGGAAEQTAKAEPVKKKQIGRAHV